MSEEINIYQIIIKFKKTFKIIIQKWKLILIMSILGSFFGYFYASSKNKIYFAELTFAVEDNQSSGLGGSLANTFGLDLGTSSEGMFSSKNLIELFKSRRMVEKTLLSPIIYNKKIISLAEMFIINNRLRNVWKNKPKIKNIKFSPSTDRGNFTFIQDSVLGEISELIINKYINIIQKDKKSMIMTIVIKCENEKFAKYFTETITKVVMDDYIELKSKKGRLNVTILQNQTDSVRNELNNAISGVAKANDNTFNLNPALNVHRIPSAKKEVDIQANSAILGELVKQLEMSKVSLRKETPFIQIIDQPILPLKSEKLSNKKGIIIGGLLSVLIMTAYYFIIFNLQVIKKDNE